jgi:hypothetical protein
MPPIYFHRFLKKTTASVMGYINDQNGIIDRYYREQGGWKPHLENTKKYILETAKEKGNKSVAVLGSGWLLDVPVEELCKMFQKVFLYDIVHPREIKEKIKKYSNVFFVELDISGGAVKGAFRVIREFNKNNIKSNLSQIELSGFVPVEEHDFVVSVNILNQLDILAVDYLRKYNIYDDSELNEFRKRIQASHVDSLPKGKSCLISDVEELVYSGNQLELKKSLVYTDIPAGINNVAWTWDFDRSGNYNKGKQTFFRVIAMAL